MMSSAFKAVPFALMMAMSGCSADHDGIREGPRKSTLQDAEMLGR